MKVYPFNKRQLNVLAALLTLLVVCSVYESLRAFGLLSPSLTPSLGKTAESLVDLLSDRAFVVDTVITLARTTFGVLAGAIAGIPIGFLMGLSSWARRGTLPFIDFLRALPAVALFPALATVFGIGETMKILLIALPSGLMVAIFSYYACAEVRPALLEYLSLRRATRWNIVRYVYIPGVFARLPAGLRYALPLGLVLSVVADMFVGSKHGLGLRLVAFQETFQLSRLYGTIIVTGFLGLLLNCAAEALWKISQKRSLSEGVGKHL